VSALDALDALPVHGVSVREGRPSLYEKVSVGKAID
jgi:hypothetical protein